jgi:hypothetical protein
MAGRFATRLVYLTLVAGVMALGGAAGTAMAAPAALKVSPNTIVAGGSVQITGYCEANSTGFAISPAFLHDATHDFAGVAAVSFSTNAAGTFSVTAQIPASIAPGNYSVGARCGGGNLGISAALTVTGQGGLPSGVPAGSGGRAATTSPHERGNEVLVGGIGLVVAIGAIFGLGRLRRPART